MNSSDHHVKLSNVSMKQSTIDVSYAEGTCYLQANVYVYVYVYVYMLIILPSSSSSST